MVIFKNQKPFYYMVLQSVPTAQEKVAAYSWEKVLEYGAASATKRQTYPAHKFGTKYDFGRSRHLFF